MPIEAIKEAVAGFPKYDRRSLAAWLNELDYDDWDKQMVSDFSPGGLGMALVEKVEGDIGQGKAVSLEAGLEQTNASQNRLRQ